MIEKQTLVFCDGCRLCSYGHALAEGQMSRRSVAYQIRSEGWEIVKGKHYCPDCYKRIKEEGA